MLLSSLFDKDGNSIQIKNGRNYNLELLPEFSFEIMLKNLDENSPNFSGPSSVLYLYFLQKFDMRLDSIGYTSGLRNTYVNNYLELIIDLDTFHPRKISDIHEVRILFPKTEQRIFACVVNEFCGRVQGMFAMTPYLDYSVFDKSQVKLAKHHYVDAINTILKPAFPLI